MTGTAAGDDGWRLPAVLPLDVALSLGPGRELVLDRHQRGVRYSAAGLPPGLELDEATGMITGIPRRAGVYRVTITSAAVLSWPWSWLRRCRLTKGGG